MAGGKSTPKKDTALKITGGQLVRKGQILARGLEFFKAGRNVTGRATLYAVCDGKVAFIRKKTTRGRPRTFINVLPA
ncbi:MAG: 50S ribosomal protein L27 [Candidatus Omnitrophota bacterium]|nr:50S ribosomal protein L27 [Candidatus Omnitrophota bacterium]